MAGHGLRFAIRLLGSSVLASIVVLGMLVAGMQFWGVFDQDERELDLQELRLLSAYDRAQLAALLGDDRRAAPPRPELEEIPRPPAPQREGFVQLEVTVAADGSVEHVEVTGAAPAGIYEDEARRLVLGRRYPPAAGDAARTHTEIVDFTVPRE
jgi:TonB family protein